MPFPTVVIGQKIKASWGNLVGARFNEAHNLLAFSPGANTDATTGGSLVTWLTLGNVTVPAWAVSAIVDFHLIGGLDITAAFNQYNMRLDVGTDQGQEHRQAGSSAGGNERFGLSFADRITLTSTGSKSITLKAARLAGTGQWRADIATDAIAVFTFLDN